MKEITESLFNIEEIDVPSQPVYPLGSARKEIEDRYRELLHEELSLSSLVTYVGNRNIPFLRLYRYKEAFSFNLVKKFLKRFNATPNDYVFDPFSGMGTTLLTAFTENIPSIGVDKLPIAYFTSKTLPQFFRLEQNELKEIWNSLVPKIQNAKPACVAENVAIMNIAFDIDVLYSLRKIKGAIDILPMPYKDIFLLLFFSILEECSYTSKDGQYLRIVKSKQVSNPIEALAYKITKAEEDVVRAKTVFGDPVSNNHSIPGVYLGDTRDLSNINFQRNPSIIITSPPYVNRYDYSRIYALELCFHFVKTPEELKEIRFSILRSHIESRVSKSEIPNHRIIEEIVEALRKMKLNNPKIPAMVTAYFIDMKKVIGEWYSVLTPGAKVAMVVDNVRFEGELIPVDLILSDMAEIAGFKVKEIIVARYKGNSSQQMKKYGRVPVRESIVVWER
jgi:site-specific DNA-methyltransferase (cytosine-N4-specific)